MKLIDEIQHQSSAVRHTLFGLAVFVVLSTVGFIWVTGLQREVFMALHDDPAERAEFLAQQDAASPRPFTIVARGVGVLTAAISSFIGFDREQGITATTTPTPEGSSVHLLPISN